MFACFRDRNMDNITPDQVPIHLEHTQLELIHLEHILLFGSQAHTNLHQVTYQQDNTPLVSIPHQRVLLLHILKCLIHPVHLLQDLDINQVMLLYLQESSKLLYIANCQKYLYE